MEGFGFRALVVVSAAGLLGMAQEVRAEVFCKSPAGALRLRVACRPRETKLPISIVDGGKTVVVTGANLRIVNGTSATDGTQNGLGNVIIGYNAENRPDVGDGPDIKTGSHNLVIGDEHTYSGTSGLVVGLDNAITGVGSTVTGGINNTASGDFASISGGQYNQANGIVSSISGGLDNQAVGQRSSILGGELNVTGERATVTGGRSNDAAGVLSVVVGGDGNTAAGTFDIAP